MTAKKAVLLLFFIFFFQVLFSNLVCSCGSRYHYHRQPQIQTYPPYPHNSQQPLAICFCGRSVVCMGLLLVSMGQMPIQSSRCHLQQPGYLSLWLALFNPFPGLGYLLHGKPLRPPQDAATGSVSSMGRHLLT